MKQLNWYQIFGQTHTIPDGRTVTPTDDIQIWLNCADIWDKTYTTLAEVLADTDTLSALIASENAVDYMVRSTTWAVSVSVPTMTSNTTPSGECFGNSHVYGSNYYHAFDDSSSTYVGANSNQVNGLLLGYKFTSPISVGAIKFWNRQNNPDPPTYGISHYKLQGSNDNGLTWTDITSELVMGNPYSTTPWVQEISNASTYKMVGLYVINAWNGASTTQTTTEYCNINKIQFYSTSVTNNSAAMTLIGANNYCANTLLSGGENSFVKYPYAETTVTKRGVTFTDNGDGSIKVNGTNTGSGDAAFFVISYTPVSNYFTKAGTYVLNPSPSSPFDTKLRAFFGIQKDGVWTSVNHWWKEDNSGEPYSFTITEEMMNDSSYLVMYSIRVMEGQTVNNVTVKLNADTTWCNAICNSPYFESVLNVKVPKMTSNTSPEGICTSVNSLGSGSAYNVFDRNSSTSAQPNQYPCIIGYTFTATKKIYMAVAEFSEAGRIPGNFKIQYAESSSLTPGTDIKTVSSPSLITRVVFDSAVEKASFCFNSSSNGTQGWLRVKNLQFYGRKDV